MEKLLIRLEQTGANPRIGIRNMLDDESMYARLLQDFLLAGEIGPLREQIEAARYPEAFLICHKMKGSSVTLALTPLSEALSQLTELLRPYHSGAKETALEEERPLIMLALSRAESLITYYKALLENFPPGSAGRIP